MILRSCATLANCATCAHRPAWQRVRLLVWGLWLCGLVWMSALLLSQPLANAAVAASARAEDKVRAEAVRAEDELNIPHTTASLRLDGLCDTGAEYRESRRVALGPAFVYLLHDDDSLWVCFDDLPATRAQAHASLGLDLDLGRLNPIQPDDFVLQVTSRGETQTLAGSGRGGLVETTEGSDRWEASYQEQRDRHSAEFRLDSDWLPGLDHLFGLRLGSETDTQRHVWPAGAVLSQPGRWGRAILEGGGQLRTFRGRVTYQAQDGSVHPAAQVGIALIGGNRDGGESVVALVQTDADGVYSLSSTDAYGYHRLELDTRMLPRGYRSLRAAPAGDGTSLDSRTISFADLPPGAYEGNDFALQDTVNYSAAAAAVDYHLRGPEGPYFLIVTTQWIADESLGLHEFVQFKTQLGFTVEIVTLEEIEQIYSAIPGRHNKIRQLEKNKRTLYGDRFQYLLLIGPPSAIPHVKLGILASSTPIKCEHGELTDTPGEWKYSDWFYVDLVSDFDSNGNGCYADGLWDKALQPGYVPDKGILFTPTVAVGRIPFIYPNVVSQVLEKSMQREKSGFNPEAILSMSAVSLEGWTYKDSLLFDVAPCQNMWSSCVPVSDGNYDTAVLGEAIAGYLTPQGFEIETLYETFGTEAGGSGIQPTFPLAAGPWVTADRIDTVEPGYVNLSGHGSGAGVSRRFWKGDKNGTGLYEYSKEPISYTVELGKESLLTRFITSKIDNKLGSLYFVNACSTADPDYYDNFVYKLLAEGDATALYAALNIVVTGSWHTPADGRINSTNFYVTQAALRDGWRFGDALWHVLAGLIADGSRATGEIAMAYFGDPTLAYWGQPGGHSVGEAWSMARQNPYGHSWANRAGPGKPQELWSWAGLSATTPAALPPSPVIDQEGRIFVGRGANLDVYSLDGALVDRLPLQAKAFGTPALAADHHTARVYVVDTEGLLYSFLRYSTSDEHMALGTLDLGGTPQTSPIVGSDGFVSIVVKGDNGKARLVLVRTDGGISGGKIFNQIFLEGDAAGPPAVHPDRTIYVTTRAGQLVRYNPFHDPPIEPDKTTLVPYTTPPLLAKDAIYAGRSNWTLVKMDRSGKEEKSFFALSEITAGPVLGPGGQILFGTQDGTLYSLTEDLELRWQQPTGAPLLGIPAFTTDALYTVNLGGIQAYHPHSGEALWSRPIAETVTGGSVAVGPTRHLVVYTNVGKLVAYGEGWMVPPTPPAVEHVDDATAGYGLEVMWELPESAIALHASTVVNPVANTVSSTVANRVAYTPTHILLQRSEAGGAWQTVATLPPGTTSYRDTSVARGVAYAYRLQIGEENGSDSDFAYGAAPMQSLPEPPPAPTINEAAALSAHAIMVQWPLPAGEEITAWRLERSLDPGGPFEAVREMSAGNSSATDEGLAPGTAYTYRLVALNGAGESPPSNGVSATTFAQTLAPPQSVVIQKMTAGELLFTWNAAPPGAVVVIEYEQGTHAGFLDLATAPGDQPYTHAATFDEPVNSFRLKFVQDNTESPFVTAQVTQPQTQMLPLYLPVIRP